MDLSVIAEFLTNFALNNPKLAGVCAVLYLSGICFKILRESVEKFVMESPSKEDDKKLEEIKKNPVYKAVSFACDLFLRLKKPESK